MLFILQLIHTLCCQGLVLSTSNHLPLHILFIPQLTTFLFTPVDTHWHLCNTGVYCRLNLPLSDLLYWLGLNFCYILYTQANCHLPDLLLMTKHLHTLTAHQNWLKRPRRNIPRNRDCEFHITACCSVAVYVTVLARHFLHFSIVHNDHIDIKISVLFFHSIVLTQQTSQQWSYWISSSHPGNGNWISPSAMAIIFCTA